MQTMVIVSTARAEPNKLLNIATVYWLMDERLRDSGMPLSRFRGQNARPPSDLTITVSRDGVDIPATFRITRRFQGGGAARVPFHARALQELEVSLDPLIAALPAGGEAGHFVLVLSPPANALSNGPAGPETGDNSQTRPGNCGSSEDGAFDGLFRPVRLAFDIQGTGEQLEIINLANDEDLADDRGPHWNVVLHPDASSGLRQRIMLDWKPDWLRRVLPSRKPELRSRGSRAISMVVIHNIGGTATAAESEDRIFPNGGAAVAEFLQHRVKGIHYVVDVDGHITKLSHEDFGGNHSGESGQIPKWRHVGRTSGRVRASSIGIEHALFGRSPEFYPALITASLDLVEQLCNAHPTILPWNLVGHSDVVRKAACPGINFPWHRYEAVTIQRTVPGQAVPVPFPMALDADLGHKDTTMYNGLFAADAGATISENTTDADAITELQRDLREIGWLFGDRRGRPGDTVTGRFGDDTKHAVAEFHSRFLNGAAETPPVLTAGRVTFVNFDSAKHIKRVLHRLDTLEGLL